MSTSYPSGLDNFTNPTASDYEDVVSHAGQHANANDAIEAIESTLGTTAGTAVIDNFSAGERALAIAGTATLKNVDAILDEDDMASDSATALATQQSIKAMHDTGWTAITETLTYASATTITVASGAATRYQKGDKLKLTQTTDKYFYIIDVADTLLTITGGTDYTLANATITSPQLSRIESPFGFPSRFTLVENKKWLRISGNEAIVNGWGAVDPGGTNLRISASVSFGITFDSAPMVQVSPLGQAAATPTAITDFTQNWGGGTREMRYDAIATTITTTSFIILLSGSDHPVDLFGFSFEVRGVI